MKSKSKFAARSTAGFSLAELMVVIVIIGLLATVVVPNVMSKLGKANLTKAKNDLRAIAEAVDSYRMDNGMRFPDSLEDLVTEDDRGTKYLKQDNVPKDPWGNEYIFEPPSGGSNDFLIWTFGLDGSQGGEGDNMDVNHRMVINGEV